jgi:hypothetical protein
VHLIALLQQQLGQVGTVLAGDPGDESALHSILVAAIDAALDRIVRSSARKGSHDGRSCR